MAGNTDTGDETLDSPSNTKSENLSEKDISADEPDSSIPKQETENMEVHHHPHLEKKNFKEYLLEGLMIFLAVTMGFIAENIREHFTDVRTEKEYLSSFKQQLLINKEQFTDLQNRFIDYKPALDSLSKLFFGKN